MSSDLRCQNCGADFDPVLPDCPECGHEVPADARETLRAMGKSTRRKRRSRFPIPWGLLIFLGLYFGGVWLYVRNEYYLSKEYQAAVNLRTAAQLLGEDDGRTAKLDALMQAAEHLLAGLQIHPDDPWAHQQLEVILRRVAERGLTVPHDMQMRLDAVAHRYGNIKNSKNSVLLIGARDVWDVDGILEAPSRIMHSSVAGALIIIALWLVKASKDRRYMEQVEAERLTERARDLEKLGQHRRRTM